MATTQNIDIYGVKEINELTQLNKLNGKEEMLIDNGEVTLKVTVDTLLGYIRDQINSGTYNGSRTLDSGIIFIPEGESIPSESRYANHFYVNVVEAQDAHLTSGLPTIVKVSPNMALRMIIDS